MRLSRWLVGSIALFTLGCGSNGPELHPVSGTVTFDGQPADGATVVFHLVNGPPDALKPSGVTGKDGSFTLRSYPHGAGAPPGEYAVLVTWLTGGKGGDAKNKLPDRYSDPAQSGLKVTVKPGENKLEPFALSKKAR